MKLRYGFIVGLIMQVQAGEPLHNHSSYRQASNQQNANTTQKLRQKAARRVQRKKEAAYAAIGLTLQSAHTHEDNKKVEGTINNLIEQEEKQFLMLIEELPENIKQRCLHLMQQEHMETTNIVGYSGKAFLAATTIFVPSQPSYNVLENLEWHVLHELVHVFLRHVFERYAYFLSCDKQTLDCIHATMQEWQNAYKQFLESPTQENLEHLNNIITNRHPYFAWIQAQEKEADTVAATIDPIYAIQMLHRFMHVCQQSAVPKTIDELCHPHICKRAAYAAKIFNAMSANQ